MRLFDVAQPIWIGLLLSHFLTAQQQPNYLNPVPKPGQTLIGSAGANEGSFGVAAHKSQEGFVVSFVTPGSPAERAGLRQGSVIKAIDGKEAAGLSQMDFHAQLRKRPGESVRLVVTDGRGPDSTVNVVAEARSKVYPQEAQAPPAVSQLVLDGQISVSAALAQDNPQRVFLWLLFSNRNGPVLNLDDSKFFVLSGQGQQLHRVTLEEIHYSIQAAVAQSVRSGTYIPPPPAPPQKQYTITGTQNGNYTLQDLGGGLTRMSGTSSSTYIVTPQPDYSQLGYSLGLAIRQWRDRKHDQKIIQEAQQAINQWDTTYLRTDAPVIQGENRTGAVTFWAPQPLTGPFKVVLFVTDPTTSKDESVVFEFH